MSETFYIVNFVIGKFMEDLTIGDSMKMKDGNPRYYSQQRSNYHWKFIMT